MIDLLRDSNEPGVRAVARHPRPVSPTSVPDPSATAHFTCSKYQSMRLNKSNKTQNHVAFPPMSESDIRRNLQAIGENLFDMGDLRGLTALGSIVLAASLLTISLVSTGGGQPVLLTVLATLAVLGAFFIFAFIAGHITIGDRLSRDELATRVADRVREGLQLTTTDGAVIWTNARMADLVGTPHQEGVNAMEAALGGAPEVAQTLFRLMRAVERGETACEDVPVRLVNDALGPCESITHLRIMVQPFALPGFTREVGPVFLWSLRDISAEVAAARQITMAMRSTLSLYDSMPVGLIAASADGHIHHINSTLTHWMGLSLDRTRNKAPVQLADLLPPDAIELIRDRAGVRGDGASPRSTHSSGHEAAGDMELDLLCENGRALPVRLISHVVPGALSDGTDVTVIAVINRAEEEARRAGESASRLGAATIFRQAPFGIATLSSDGRILSSNATFSRMVLDPSGGVGEPARNVLGGGCDEDTTAQLSAALDKALDGKAKIAPIELRFGAEGEFTRRVYFAPLTRSEEASETAIIYLVDVTEQKALELKFAQSQKMEAVGKLAGFVAHDFNNMLTAIIGFSDFLLQTHRPTDPAHADIMNIKNSASRAAGLVGKLLALARQQTLLIEPLQLGDVMTDLAPILKRSIGERIDLQMSSGRDLWYVKTDKLQLDQAIINLAVNARDAMAETGGTLTIRTRNITERESQRLQAKGMTIGEYVLIEVEDTGSGMPPDMLDKIFEPFFTTKAAGKGTGLGLATVYGIVKQTGGFIYPESKVGLGTTFRIYLPRYHLDAKDEAQIEKVKTETAERKTLDVTGTGRVLLVEDEDVVRSFSVRALTRQGYEVLEAADGLEALKVMDENPGRIDIVVSDVVMPEMDGPTMLKEMRKTNPNLKIIFVSGYPNEAFQQALGEETFAFLPKPFSLPQLAAKVKEQLGR